jgi:hypothetical protein
MSRLCVAIAICASLLLGTGAFAVAAEPPGVPEVVQRAQAVFTTSMRGILGLQRHFTTTIDAGIARHSEESESGMLFKDGVFVTAKYYKIVDDNKPLSEKQIVDRDAQTNQGWATGKIFFKEPYDPRYVGDYKFAEQAGCDCGMGMVAVTFSSEVRDAQHGAGTMWIQSASGRVTKLTYTPYVLPPHATSGTCTETSGEALPNVWTVMRIDEVYQGRELILKGSATFVGTFDHFERFSSVAEGETAVQKGTIGTVVSR